MTLKHFLKRQNRSKNKIWKITEKSQNDVKSDCFWRVLCYISDIFEDIDLKFCTHIHETLPSNICYVFVVENLFWGNCFVKENKLDIVFDFFLKMFKILKIRDSSFIALLILVISYKSIDRSLKTAPVAANPVNPFCWSKSAKHDVTLTSLTADLLWPGT